MPSKWILMTIFYSLYFTTETQRSKILTDSKWQSWDSNPYLLTPKLVLSSICHPPGGKYCSNSNYVRVILKCYFTNCYINTYKSSAWPQMVNCPLMTKSSNWTTNWNLIWGSILANRFQQLTPKECQLQKLASGYKWLCKICIMTRWEGIYLTCSGGSEEGQMTSHEIYLFVVCLFLILAPGHA